MVNISHYLKRDLYIPGGAALISSINRMNVSPNSTQGAANKIRSCRGHTGLGHRTDVTERLDARRFGSSKKATKFPRGFPCFLVGGETNPFAKY